MQEIKTILIQILDRLADTAASLDALELELAEIGVLRSDAVHKRFHTHKSVVEQHLLGLRGQIQSL